MLAHFKDIWGEFDPEASNFISLYQLRSFLIALSMPLGFNPEELENRYLQDKFIASL